MRWRSGVIVVSEVRGKVPEDQGTTQCRAEIVAHHHRFSGLDIMVARHKAVARLQ
jgi:hypothetical protein